VHVFHHVPHRPAALAMDTGEPARRAAGEPDQGA